ncbi:AMP-binding protein [Arthrobacter sp. FW305-BF8]|uniref:AMP-binding protein n=1 Tax=Arthrobacter sp. FW305-BF8 TaxID=2879617 RepID=UPI003FA4A9DD|nr:AMP-binding protein [Arthrobacter sp. FW305-BF8]
MASYGMTEAGASISFRRRTDATGKAESSGTPALLTDVRVVSADGTELPPGETGEILVRGPHTASSYCRAPKQLTQPSSMVGLLPATGA